MVTQGLLQDHHAPVEVSGQDRWQGRMRWDRAFALIIRARADGMGQELGLAIRDGLDVFANKKKADEQIIGHAGVKIAQNQARPSFSARAPT